MSSKSELLQGLGDKAVAEENHEAAASASDHSLDQQYLALDPERKEIRVLEVLPGTGDEPVYGTLQRVSLLDDPKPSYETISYVWGDKTNVGTIYLHDHAKKVPASAEAVLRRVRFPAQSRAVWIDSICIDQDNVLERSQQVAFMHKIYASGLRNLIWLGEDDGSTAAALLDIEKIIKNMRAETNNFRDVKTILYHGTHLALRNTPGILDLAADGGPLEALFTSPWFTRLWVVQEAALSIENVCYRGAVEFPLEDALTAALWVRYQNWSLNELLGKVQFLANFADRRCGIYHLSPNMSVNLLSYFDDLRNFDAADPRDHIYGCLGLIQRFECSEEIPFGLIPDYEASVEEVFSKATKTGIMDAGHLDVLRRANRREKGDWPNLPSWVPRWDSRDDVAALGQLSYAADNKEFFDRGLLKDTDTKILPVQGFVIGSITEVAPNFPLESDIGDGPIELYMDFLRFASALSRRGRRSESDGNVDVKLAATLIASSELESEECLSEEECVRRYTAFRSYLDAKGLPWGKFHEPFRQTASEDDMMAAEYRSQMKLICRRRRLFLTASGLLGVGPRAMKEGDMAVVLYGVRTPFILRRLQASEKATHYLVGHCYLHGIMGGEAVKQHRAEGKEDEIFYLG